MNDFIARPIVENLLFALFVLIVFSLVLARFTVFKTTNRRSLVGSFFYDPIVATHIGFTAYSYFTSSYNDSIPLIMPFIFYLGGGSLFFWAIKTTRELSFALSDIPEKLVSRGAFLVVRHPYYTSYILTWTASCLAYSSSVIWATQIYLTAFYVYSAREEEKKLLQGKYAADYQIYQHTVGMFLPRMTLWLS